MSSHNFRGQPPRPSGPGRFPDHRRVGWIGPILVWLAVFPASGLDLESSRIGRVSFGMSRAEVAAIVEIAPVDPSASPPLQFYSAGRTSFQGVSPCSVVYGFFDDRLFQVRYDCGADARVAALLRREYGEPTEMNEKQDIWRGDRNALAMSKVSKAFSLTDNALAGAVNEYVLKLRSGHPQGGRSHH